MNVEVTPLPGIGVRKDFAIRGRGRDPPRRQGRVLMAVLGPVAARVVEPVTRGIRARLLARRQSPAPSAGS